MEEKRLALEEGSITYLIDGKGPTVLFLHGGFAPPRAYIPFIELVAQHYTVIAPTHPGHGDSFPLPDPWRFEDYGSVYKHFFQALHLTSLPVISHSFGGAIAFFLAGEHLAASLVAFDPVGLPVTVTPKQYVETLSHEAQDMFPEVVRRKQLSKMLSATGNMLYSTMKHLESIPWFETKAERLDLRALLPTIDIPVHLFWGEEDHIAPVSIGEEMKKLLPHATLTVFPGKGHAYIAIDPEFTYNEFMKIQGDHPRGAP